MMKRKVSVIWMVVLAIIAIAACAFAAVTYYRCGKQPKPQFPENELLRVLDAGSDAEGVGFEVMRIGGGSVNLRLDLRWKNDSGKTIAYGLAFELYHKAEAHADAHPLLCVIVFCFTLADRWPHTEKGDQQSHRDPRRCRAQKRQNIFHHDYFSPFRECSFYHIPLFLRFGMGNSSYIASNSSARNSLLSTSSISNISLAPSYGISQIAHTESHKLPQA